MARYRKYRRLLCYFKFCFNSRKQTRFKDACIEEIAFETNGYQKKKLKIQLIFMEIAHIHLI